MSLQIPAPDAYQEIREALWDLCGSYEPLWGERNQPGVLRQSRDTGGEPDRTGGNGFKYILDGLNKARMYADERIVFNRPIGQNQGVAFPIAGAYMETQAANRIYSYVAEHLLGLPRSF